MMAVAHAPVAVATSVTTISSSSSVRRLPGDRSFYCPVCGMNDFQKLIGPLDNLNAYLFKDLAFFGISISEVCRILCKFILLFVKRGRIPKLFSLCAWTGWRHCLTHGRAVSWHPIVNPFYRQSAAFSPLLIFLIPICCTMWKERSVQVFKLDCMEPWWTFVFICDCILAI